MSFTPPTSSLGQLAGVPFDDAVDTAPEAKQRFDNFDNLPKNTDHSKCNALLKFPGGTIFWSSQMAIDAGEQAFAGLGGARVSHRHDRDAGFHRGTDRGADGDARLSDEESQEGSHDRGHHLHLRVGGSNPQGAERSARECEYRHVAAGRSTGRSFEKNRCWILCPAKKVHFFSSQSSTRGNEKSEDQFLSVTAKAPNKHQTILNIMLKKLEKKIAKRHRRSRRPRIPAAGLPQHNRPARRDSDQPTLSVRSRNIRQIAPALRHPNEPFLVDITLDRNPNVESDDKMPNMFRPGRNLRP